MKLTRLTMACVASCAMLMASAQSSGEAFEPHWRLGLQAGAAYTLGEGSFSDLLSPAAQISIARKFNPVIGLRLSVAGWESRGVWVDPEQKYKYNYIAPNIEVTASLTNAIWGYNPNRVVNVDLMAGGGLNMGFGNDDAQEVQSRYSSVDFRHLWDGTKLRPVGRFGLSVNFRVSERVDLTVEGNANIISDHYNSKHAPNCDWYFNALAGVSIRLGGSKAKPLAMVPDPEPVQEPAPVQPVVTPEPEPEPAPVVAQEPEQIQVSVFFTIRSSRIREAERVKCDEVVRFLKSHPDAKVVVTGYADRGTGNARVNKRYAANRANSVTRYLKEQGIDASRITTTSKGDTEQPYAENDLNRVSICVAK
ncbi:MAG: OmpA family protein [Muribaculaceae bacterium]